MCEERESDPWAGRMHGHWGGGYGPWMRHGMWMKHDMCGDSGPRSCPCCGREIKPPTKEEKNERMEAFKKRLEEKISKIDGKIEAMKKEASSPYAWHVLSGSDADTQCFYQFFYF